MRRQEWWWQRKIGSLKSLDIGVGGSCSPQRWTQGGSVTLLPGVPDLPGEKRSNYVHEEAVTEH